MHDHAADDELLGVFRKLGVSLTKPREVNFYFLFPGESDADSARAMLLQSKIESDKTRIDVPWWKRLFTRPQWMVSVTQTMPLDEARIKSTTAQFQKIATRCNGRYDGWEANVMDDHINSEQLEGLGQ
jgi:hypothetical protein